MKRKTNLVRQLVSDNVELPSQKCALQAKLIVSSR